MARNITVTLADGSTHVYRGAPDNVTPDQVMARARKEFGQDVHALDGGKNPARAPVPVTTRRQDVAATARQTRDQQLDAAGRHAAQQTPGGNFLTAYGAGLRRSMFGIPERLAAAGERFLPSAITGNRSNLSYDDILHVIRARTDAEQGRSTSGNILGTLLGTTASVVGTGGIVRGGTGVVARVSPRAGRAVQAVTTMQKGQKVKNIFRAMAAGSAAGGAQAAGEGSDVTTGMEYGAAAPLVLGGAVKLGGAVRATGRAIARPFSGNMGKALREVITEDPAALASRQAELSARTGDNVPVVAALRDRDFRAVANRVLKPSDDANEAAKNATTAHVRSFMDRMIRHVNTAGRTGNTVPTTLGDLAQLRQDTADDLMAPIKDRQIDMSQIPLDDLEQSVTRDIGMRDKNLAPRIKKAFTDIPPDDLKDAGISGNDMAAARRLMAQWGLNEPVHASVQELDALRRSLDAAGKAAKNSNPANSMAFRNAAKTIRDHVESIVPEYGQMVDTYAAHSRVMEGFEHAAGGNRVSDTADNVLRKNLQTPEGRIGMKAGQLYRLRQAAGAKPSSAVALARDAAAGGDLTRAPSLAPDAAQPGTVTEHLGEQAAAGLQDSSDAEYQVLQRLLQAGGIDAAKVDPKILDNPETLAYGATLIGGGALPSTVARFTAKLAEKLPHGFNPKVAANMADMLFSQDPAKSQQVLNALEKVGIGRQIVTGLMRNSVAAGVGQIAATGAQPDNGQPAPAPGQGEPDNGMSDVEALLGTGTAGASAPASEGGPEANPSGYAVNLQQMFDGEDPRFIDLVERVAGRESRHRQTNPDGSPVTSSAGAIGLMQVMPETAPEAARLAGVPYDDNAYKTDPAYNKLIGAAYLGHLLHRYQGSVPHALAAYNAGPKRVDDALAAGQEDGDWIAHLPQETKDYVEALG